MAKKRAPQPARHTPSVTAGEAITVTDWGKAHALGFDPASGEDRTIITIVASNAQKSAAEIAKAVKFLKAEHPGAEIQVRDLAGAGWERVV